MTNRRSIATTLALVLPALILVVGALVTAGQPREESDWLGLGRLFTFLAALVLAAFVCLFFAGIAGFRREPRAGVSLIGAVPAVVVIIAAVVFAAAGLQGNFERERHRELVARLVADPALRHQLVLQQPLDTLSTRALLSYEVRDLLTPSEVARIWDQRKDIDTGSYFRSLIGPAYTPESVLREYFDRLMALESARWGEPTYRSLIDHIEFLRHRNLPQDIIDEILEGAEPDVVVQVQRNARLTSDPVHLKRWADVPPQ